MSTLDRLLSDTNLERAPRILSEVHDPNQIRVEESDIERALRSAGGWDAAEYGITAARARELLREANTPEARERVLADLKQRALRRASLDTSNGKVSAAFALKPAWHGLGTVVDRTMTSAEALHLSRMDWQVKKTQLSYLFDGQTHYADSWGIVRQDTGACLGVVGSRYVPIQNAEGFDFLDSVIGAYGAKYESAGAIYGGASVWLLVHMPKQTFHINDDRIEPYLLFSNSHDGSGAALCCPTTVRVQCANTMRTALRGRSGKGLSIRHTGSVSNKIVAACKTLGLAVNSFADYREKAQTLVSKPAHPENFAHSVLDEILDMTRAEIKRGVDAVREKTGLEGDEAWQYLDSRVQKRSEILADIMTRYESERCHPKGTAWAALNSVTEHCDHHTLGRQVGNEHTRASRRFESTLSGARDEMKQIAFAQALAL